ncbi:MAG: peptide chain release factor N(5)-glutamine methyltransferase [Arcobacteraceae bacterium]|jgi:release factor glutamine methyltransferase|nr:peptide chain release factor N(5)-glutamine methyltransferase [Arcobacteraceae bacterium]
MTIEQFIKDNITRLKEITDIPQKELYILLGFVLQKDFIWLTLNNTYTIKEEYLDTLKKYVELRANAYPIEYITCRASFYSEEFEVCEGVLIPRPETEILIDKAYEILSQISSPKVLEIGVGSGIISTILAKKIPDIKIIAIDINPKALELSKLNAIKHQVADKIEFRLSDMFENVQGEYFDMLVSNPPYIAADFVLPKNVTYEPKEALFGGTKGDEMIISMIQECKQRGIKYFCCEMGYDQKEPFTKEFLKYDCEFEFYEDYSGFDRGFVLNFK